MDQIHKLWVEKYRPTSISEYIFHDNNQKLAIMKMIADKSIPHLLLTGVAGSGKTTLAQILINELGIDDMDVLTLNSSDENSVDDIRGKIQSFISTYAMGSFKIIHLSEGDYLSPQAQGCLRHLMEEYSDSARFILTANYENKIIPPLKSRFQHFRFKATNKDDIAEYIVKILSSERIKFDLPLIDKYISFGYPDIRKIINLLQQNSINNVLQQPISTGETGDYKFKLLDLIESDTWNEARKLICENIVAEDWEEMYRFLYQNIGKAPKFSQQNKWEEGIVIIADHLFKNSLVADQEINFAAMMIRLSQI